MFERLGGQIEKDNGENALTSFINDSWFSDLESSSAYMRIYTSLNIPHEAFIPSLKGALKQIEFDYPVRISYARIHDMKFSTIKPLMYAGEDGTTIVETHPDERQLKNSNYIVLTTPYLIDGERVDFVDVQNRLDATSSLVCGHMGVNFMWELVARGEVTASEGKFSMPHVDRLPPLHYGPFINTKNWDDIEEIIIAINSLEMDTQGRIRTALEYYNKALRDEVDFLHYWLSLEILCDGSAKKVRSNLLAHYETLTDNDLDTLFGFKNLVDLRNDYIHRGINPHLSHDLARYLQLLFIDLLREELQLSCRSHLYGICNNKDYDLSKIGL